MLDNLGKHLTNVNAVRAAREENSCTMETTRVRLRVKRATERLLSAVRTVGAMRRVRNQGFSTNAVNPSAPDSGVRRNTPSLTQPLAPGGTNGVMSSRAKPSTTASFSSGSSEQVE